MNRHQLTILLPDIRSAQNVGAIMRTADAVGARVWTSGITPYPIIDDDARPPHVADRATHLIAKTALGAELTAFETHYSTFEQAIASAKELNLIICALEQTLDSVNIFDYGHEGPLLLVVGPEVEGLDNSWLAACDVSVEIPMIGHKESLNVAVAAGIAMYALAQSTRTE
jgi:tRNA G18 (ribose-2'-O)-methylase SpoU